MKKNRGVPEQDRLTNGPGNLTKALDIDGSFNGEDMVKSERLWVVRGEPPARIVASPRIGISKGRERRWRFFIQGNAFVSKRNA